MSLHAPSRREAMLGAGALFAWSYAPKLARAEGRDPRVLVVVLRGALDGLGPLATAETRQAVARAESRQQALALAFMAPEFQRR